MGYAALWGAVVCAVALTCLAGSVQAQGLGNLQAVDTPNDGGMSITVRWDGMSTDLDAKVRIERMAPDGSALELDTVALDVGVFVDGGDEGPTDGEPYSYRLTPIASDGSAGTALVTNSAVPAASFFHTDRFNVLIILGTFSALLMFNIWRANKSPESFHIRRLAPVDAMDEAIGRATEMGRPVLYVPGIEEVQDIQTIASMLILERVAEKTAQYDVPLAVPTRSPFVLAVADEVVKSGCMAAGRPDAYRPDMVRYISNEQFAYCAGVNGTILRDKPAANFYLGRFFAESLIFAETGFQAGSIQIAGTAEVTQLPFFIAACDYTLIGEEFFAASAYMSRDPALLSTLKAADWAKVILVTALLTGAILESVGQTGFKDWFSVVR